MTVLAGTERHPHARAVLEPALRDGGAPSHAYLFHGPAGSGKRSAASAFAAELLAVGAADVDNARRRARDGVHPDLTWVAPSGAHEMLRADVDEAVVSAAAHTPFEATRRVFVLERVETMNDEAANRLLKTLEEPPGYVVLLLLTARPGDVLPTIASRCQPVRFDPLAPDAIAEQVGGDAAAARLCLGDLEKARVLASEAGAQRRALAEALARGTLAGSASAEAPWTPLLEHAGAIGQAAREQLDVAWQAEQELLAKKDRRRREREVDTAKQRAERRARTGALDHGLELVGLWFRDLACLAAGAEQLVCHVDRVDELRADAAQRASLGLAEYRAAVELVEETRARFVLNVGEELACEALASRLERLLAARD